MRRTHESPRTTRISGSPFVLMAAIVATELAILNAIFLAGAQDTYPGLVLAVLWPWIATFLLPVLWSHRTRWMTAAPQWQIARRPRVAAEVGVVLAVVLLLERLVSIA
jgi:hypothetical protein